MSNNIIVLLFKIKQKWNNIQRKLKWMMVLNWMEYYAAIKKENLNGSSEKASE